MSCRELFILYFMVFGVSSLPWPRAQKPTVNVTSDSKSPPGGWASEGHVSAANNISRASIGSLSPDSIYFPDDEDELRFVPKIGSKSPDCTTSSTFCESIEDYPSSYLDNIFKNSALEYRSMFGNDTVEIKDIAHRIDGDGEDPLCQSSEQVVFPKGAKNKDNEWLFVVNHGDYKQGVRIETCVETRNSAEGCDFTYNFPLGYKTQCKQKYIYRKLLAVNSRGEPVSDTFLLPSCCACSVKFKSPDENLRSGGGGFRSEAKTTPKGSLKGFPSTKPTSSTPKS